MSRRVLVATILVVLLGLAIGFAVLRQGWGLDLTSRAERTGTAMVTSCEGALAHQRCTGTVRWDDGSTEQVDQIWAKQSLNGEVAVEQHRRLGARPGRRTVVTEAGYPTRGDGLAVGAGVVVLALVGAAALGLRAAKRR
ncbi:hypothetical protein [Aestuariimicrobium ganziense]|uniref:hypothetical protein n=1 Tax=Aestuariimicrobium ganziense TaxID=2773677 RepID=UPI001943C78C|nr:hypothetical protein [Aestuariimicrobium ganziense]